MTDNKVREADSFEQIVKDLREAKMQGPDSVTKPLKEALNWIADRVAALSAAPQPAPPDAHPLIAKWREQAEKYRHFDHLTSNRGDGLAQAAADLEAWEGYIQAAQPQPASTGASLDPFEALKPEHNRPPKPNLRMVDADDLQLIRRGASTGGGEALRELADQMPHEQWGWDEDTGQYRCFSDGMNNCWKCRWTAALRSSSSPVAPRQFTENEVMEMYDLTMTRPHFAFHAQRFTDELNRRLVGQVAAPSETVKCISCGHRRHDGVSCFESNCCGCGQ